MSAWPETYGLSDNPPEKQSTPETADLQAVSFTDWYTGLQGFLIESGFNPDTLSTMSPEQEAFGKAVHKHIFESIHEDRPKATLPFDLVENRVRNYYRRFSPHTMHPSDRVQADFLQRFQRSNLAFVHAYKNSFPELSLALETEDEFRADGKEAAADATIGLLVGYGMGLRAIQALRDAHASRNL